MDVIINGKSTHAASAAARSTTVWKPHVVAATTQPHDLTTDFITGSVIDGVTLATNDRVLIKDQTRTPENGIYVVNASGRPTRSSDTNAADTLLYATVYVRTGDVNGETSWSCITAGPKINKNSVRFALVGGANPYSNKTLISPTLTGTPVAPTASVDTATTQVATTSFVVGQVSTIPPSMDGEPSIGTSTRFARADHIHPSDAGRVPTTRQITTEHPLRGGGTLDADLILSIDTVTDTRDGIMSSIDKVKLDASTAENVPGTLILRDRDGGFTAGRITADISGNAGTVTDGVYLNTPQTLTNKTLINPTIIGYDPGLTARDVGAAPQQHTHTIDEIAEGVLSPEHGGTGGRLPTRYGGTGITQLTPGTYLYASDASTLMGVSASFVIDDIGAARRDHHHPEYAMDTATAENVPGTFVKRSTTGEVYVATADTTTCTDQVATTAFVHAMASDDLPAMNESFELDPMTEIGSSGANARFARSDHIHPTDTSRMSATGWMRARTPITVLTRHTFATLSSAVANTVFRVGRPLRYRVSTDASWRYGIVVTVTDGDTHNVQIAGAPIVDDLDATTEPIIVEYGDFIRVRQVDVSIPGQFAIHNTARAVEEHTFRRMRWEMGGAYLVQIIATQVQADTGRAQPVVNVIANGLPVFETGITLSPDPCWMASTDDIPTPAYAVTRDDSLEVSIVSGKNGDAAHLTISMVFICE